MMRTPLSGGKQFALIDDQDWDRLSQWNWLVHRQAKGRIYAARREAKTRNLIYMHREIMNALEGLMVDHIDGDGLNNRKANLRIVTHQRNVWNTQRRGAGWFFHWQTRRYRSQIWHCGKKLDVGFFDTKEEAQEAYDFVAYHLRGEFSTYERPGNFDLSSLGPRMRKRVSDITSAASYDVWLKVQTITKI